MGQKLGFGWVVDCARRRDSRVPSSGARRVEGIWAVHLFAAALVDDVKEKLVIGVDEESKMRTEYCLQGPKPGS